MIKKILTKYLPSKEVISQSKILKFLGNTLFRDKIWYVNKSTISKACFIGFFWAFIPMPFQMIPAAICAILFNSYLPLAIALVWLTNPITMPFIWYATYRFGCFILDIPRNFDSFNISEIGTILAAIWKPLYLGSIVFGLIVGTVASILVRIIWRYNTYIKWKKRNINRKQK